jgi:hypothetical protein
LGPTHIPINTQPPLTDAATTSNINTTSTNTASITTTVIDIHFMPTIAFTVAIPSSVKRDDEADEMQWRQIIAGHYRRVLNNPPEKGYMANDKLPGWEGDDGVINNIQEH